MRPGSASVESAGSEPPDVRSGVQRMSPAATRLRTPRPGWRSPPQCMQHPPPVRSGRRSAQETHAVFGRQRVADPHRHQCGPAQQAADDHRDQCVQTAHATTIQRGRTWNYSNWPPKVVAGRGQFSHPQAAAPASVGTIVTQPSLSNASTSAGRSRRQASNRTVETVNVRPTIPQFPAKRSTRAILPSPQ
jgi:hypothetical protein